MISFCTGSKSISKKFVEACKILKITVSFGSCNSLVELPTAMSHASIDPDLCQVPKDLVRISVGIEDVRDIMSDIEQALEIATTHQEEDERRRFLLKSDSFDEDGRYDSKFEDLPRVPEPPLSDVGR